TTPRRPSRCCGARWPRADRHSCSGAGDGRIDRMTVIHSARLVSAGRETADAWVRFEGDRVAANGTGAGWRECASPAEDIVDAEGGVLAPGFIDLHGHGGGGASFDDDEESIRRALATHRAHG